MPMPASWTRCFETGPGQFLSVPVSAGAIAVLLSVAAVGKRHVQGRHEMERTLLRNEIASVVGKR